MTYNFCNFACVNTWLWIVLCFFLYIFLLPIFLPILYLSSIFIFFISSVSISPISRCFPEVDEEINVLFAPLSIGRHSIRNLFCLLISFSAFDNLFQMGLTTFSCQQETLLLYFLSKNQMFNFSIWSKINLLSCLLWSLWTRSYLIIFSERKVIILFDGNIICDHIK